MTLARLVSTLQSAAYVYLVLSVALLGLGLGAALLSLRPSGPRLAPTASALAGLSAVGIILLLRLESIPLFLVVVAGATPFIFVGASVAAIFAQQPSRSGALYWADLTGAGLGALLVLPAFDLWDVPGTGLGAALAFGGAAVLLQRHPLPILACTVAGAVIVGGALTPLTELNSRALAHKPIASALADGGRIVATRWDALTRTDVVYTPTSRSYALYMDGGAGSVIPDLARPDL